MPQFWRILIAAICLLPAGSVGCAATSLAVNPAGDVQDLLDTPWRLTRFGWAEVSSWSDVQSRDFPPLAIHPLLWTPALVLLILAVTLWATEEWEYARLWRPQRSRASTGGDGGDGDSPFNP